MRIQPQYALQRRRFDIIKEAVPVATLARDLIEEALGRLRISGDRLRGYCPVCGNGNHSEAFSASLGKNVWHCFACQNGGDVIELAKLAGNFATYPEAVAWLGWRYGVELPERPESWYRKQSRQERLREEMQRQRERVLKRRLFKIQMLPLLEGCTEAEIRAAWEDFRKISVWAFTYPVAENRIRDDAS